MPRFRDRGSGAVISRSTRLPFARTGSGAGGSGEANTTSNVGGGAGLALTKSGVDLPFKSLVAGANITLTPSATEVAIASTGGSGEVNDGVNVGSGAGLLFYGKSGVDLQFRSLAEGAGISISTDNGTVTIANTGDHDHGRITQEGAASTDVDLGAVPETDSEQVYLNGLRCRRVSPGPAGINEYTLAGQIVTFWRPIQSGEWVDATFRVALAVAHTHRRDEFTSGGQNYLLTDTPLANSEEVYLNGVRLRRVGGPAGVNEYTLATDTISLWASRAPGEYVDVVYRT